MMADLIRSEWLKLRTMRATYLVLGGTFLALLVGTVIVLTTVRAYDASTPAERADFDPANPLVTVLPFAIYVVGMLGGLAITVEYGTRSIATSLLAVPRRRDLLAAKTVVVAAATAVSGMIVAVTAITAAWLIIGDRPAPISPWPAASDAVSSILSGALVVMVTGLVALGLGTVMRSTAATVGVLGAITLVAPIFAHFLPAPWHLRLASVLLPNLAPQVAGADSPYLFSPPVAFAVLLVYAAVAIAAGLLALTSRDA